MTRRVTTLLMALSTVLLAGLVVLIVVSRITPVSVTLRDSPASAVMAGVQGGGVYVLTVSSSRGGWRGAVPMMLDDWTLNLAGFKIGPELPHWPGSPGFVVVPAWFLLLVFGSCAAACWGLRRSGDRARSPRGFAVEEELRGFDG